MLSAAPANEAQKRHSESDAAIWLQRLEDFQLRVDREGGQQNTTNIWNPWTCSPASIPTEAEGLEPAEMATFPQPQHNEHSEPVDSQLSVTPAEATFPQPRHNEHSEPVDSQPSVIPAEAAFPQP